MYRLKKNLPLIVYLILVNIPVSFVLCMTATIVSLAKIDNGNLIIEFTKLDWRVFGIDYAVSFGIAMLVGYFVPLTLIGRWFTKLFGVDNVTYKGNIHYRLLGTFIISCIYFVAISPSLTIFNNFVLHLYATPAACAKFFFINMPFMLLMGYVSSLLFDMPAYQVAHHMDSTF